MGLQGTLPFPLVPKAVKVNYRAGRKRGQLCFSCSPSCCDKVKSVGTNRSLTVGPKISWWLAHTLHLEEKVWTGLLPGCFQSGMAPILSPKENWQWHPTHCSTFLIFYDTEQVSLPFLNLFVFVFGNWQEFVSCFEISPTVSCWASSWAEFSFSVDYNYCEPCEESWKI